MKLQSLHDFSSSIVLFVYFLFFFSFDCLKNVHVTSYGLCFYILVGRLNLRLQKCALTSKVICTVPQANQLR